MKKIILFCLVINYTIVLGQQRGIWVTNRAVEKTYDGTVYLFSDWEGQNTVYDTDNQNFVLQNLNYNILTKMLETKRGKDSLFALEAKKVNFVDHASKIYRFYNIRGTRELFQELYASDNVKFLKGFNTAVKEGVINPLTQVYLQNEKVYIEEKYYIKVKSGNFNEFKLKKRSVLKLMGDKGSQIKQYASSEKISYKSEEDLVKIFVYYDTL
ncbi:MAG: hypothetical protein ACI8W0_001795 [Flavobacterium sp.]|jgi:hypothetical protein